MQILETLPKSSELGFGNFFTPQMIRAVYTQNKWAPWEFCKSSEFNISPAAKCLHYAQEVFEGLKAYKSDQGTVQLFRPQENFKRMKRSSQMLAMPYFPEEPFLESLEHLVKNSLDFIPENPGTLYLRPTLISTSPTLGVTPGSDYLFYILASPVGGYFGDSFIDKPASVKIKVSETHVRAVRGGIGAAKTGGNYASSLRAVMEAKEAGFANVLFLDALERKYIEELGGMNFFIVEDGILKTPTLGDTILAGITRDSICQIAQQLSIPVEETQMDIHQVIQGINNKSVTEAFACGTAAAITSISHLNWRNETHEINGSILGEKTQLLFQELLKIQFSQHENEFYKDWILEL